MTQGVTTDTSFAETVYKNDTIRVIDTAGFNDPQGKDYQNSQQMLNVLKSQDYINAFILVINGNDRRWDIG